MCAAACALKPAEAGGGSGSCWTAVYAFFCLILYRLRCTTSVCVRVRALKVGCGLRGALGSGKTCLPRLQPLPPARASRFYGSVTVVRDGYLVGEYAAARRSAEMPVATRYGAASAASLAGHRREARTARVRRLIRLRDAVPATAHDLLSCALCAVVHGRAF